MRMLLLVLPLLLALTQSRMPSIVGSGENDHMIRLFSPLTVFGNPQPSLV
jgi:hypothetical protein